MKSDPPSVVDTRTERGTHAVSLRSVAIGMALIPVNMIWVILMERVDGRAFSTTSSIFFTAVFSLFLVTVANAFIRGRWPLNALRQGELLTIYSVLSIATAMGGVDFGSPLVTIMAHGAWFASPENGWSDNLLPHLPKWLTIQDRSVLRGYYLGGSTMYTWQVAKAWAVPLACWTGFIVVLLWVMMCLNTVVRAQWTSKERLTYPITQLPIAMTIEDGRLYRAKLFWAGFAVSGGLSLINQLHNLYPSVPGLTFNGFDAGQLFPAPPWNAIGWTPLAVFPFVVGLGYLLPVDLLFSCWFFFLFWRMEKVAASAMGYAADHPRFPYVDEQMFGGYMAVFVFAMYSARNHLRYVLREAMHPNPIARSDPDAPMSYRTAVFGCLLGLAALIAFSMEAGLPIWLSLAFFAIYFAIALAVTRMRAELGPPTHDLHFIGPDQSLTGVMGTRGMTGDTLGVFTLYYWFNRAYRCHPMPHELEAFRMAQVSRTRAKGLVPAMLGAAVLGIVMVFWVTLHASYELGAAGRIHGWASLGYGTEAFNRLSNWISTPQRGDPGAAWGMVVGFFIASMLAIARLNIYGFPLHALGFSLSGGWSMMWAWLSLFVAWVVKALLLRYAGLRGYRAALPFFFGIILGDFMVGGPWTIIGLLTDIPIYSLWSG